MLLQYLLVSSGSNINIYISSFFLYVARLPWRHCEIETIFYSERLIANNSKDAQKQISSNFISQTVNNHKRFLRRKKRLSTFTIRLRIHGRNIHSENKPFRNTFAMYTLSNRLVFLGFFFGGVARRRRFSGGGDTKKYRRKRRRRRSCFHAWLKNMSLSTVLSTKSRKRRWKIKIKLNRKQLMFLTCLTKYYTNLKKENEYIRRCGHNWWTT